MKQRKLKQGISIAFMTGAIGLALILVPVPTWAVPFTLQGVDFPGLSADVEFAYDSSGIITIAITNTSLPGLMDPRLTAFAFNVPPEVTGVSSFSGPSGWDDLFNPNSIDPPNHFGKFDIAGITGPNFQGGDANDGIPRTSTYNFTFELTGSGLGSLTEDSFLGLDSFDAPGSPEENEQYFIARFQRVGELGGSDVAIPTGEPTAVPEPATILLLGIGLAAAGLLGRKRFRSSRS